MNKIFKFLSMLLLVNYNAQDIQTTAETSDVIIEKYKDNYIQLSREDQISKTFQFDEGEIFNYPDMEYRMYSYNLFSMPGTSEDVTPYMFPFDDHMTSNDYGTYALNYQTSSGETWYSTLYYNHFKENYHFYNIESNTIDFYVDISSFYRTSLQNNYPLEEMLNYYTEQNMDDIVFEMPLVIIDGVEVAGFLLNAIEDQYHMHFYSRAGTFEFVKTTETSPKRWLHMSIPKVDTMSDISVLQMNTATSLEAFNRFNLEEVPGGVSFVFDSSYYDKHSPFLFEVADINLLDKQVTFDHYIGHEYYDAIEYENEPLTGFIAESIKLKFNTTVRNTVGSTVKTETKTQFKTLKLSYNSTVNGAYIYDITSELPDLKTSGSVEVLQVTYEVQTENYTSDGDYKHIYENRMEHPTFSYESANAIRIYYYDLKQYGLKAANIFNNWDEIFTGVEAVLTLGISTIPAFRGFFYKLNLANNIINNYYMVQAFGFDFYFDDNKTKPIKNIKSVTTKYQYGANYSKTFDTSESYLANYPIKVRTLTNKDFEDTNWLGNYKMDKEKGVLMFDYTSENIPDDMRGLNIYENKAYDYVIMNCYKIGDLSTCIRHMESLEITYQVDGYETAKMVSNSLGLHIVDGKVYGADGTYYPEYGVYESEDGTQVVGKDNNNDGNITSDETVNSDTGKFEGDPLPEEDKWSENWKDFIDNLTKEDGILDKAKTVILVILGIGLIGVLAYGGYKIYMASQATKLVNNTNKQYKNKSKSTRKGKKRK
ncbi:MAG: hypothetical protein IJD46_02650 [Bacilli bacterium]|nr:hypothetical protein [Bacilli bacterium]